MKKLTALIFLFWLGTSVSQQSAAQLAGSWGESTPLPEKLSNNAVASLQLGDSTYLFSMMGIDTSKIFSGITRHAYRLNLGTGQWQALPDVPGPQGRIAAAAVGFRGKIYLFGGYRVLATGGEITSERVDIYDPATGQWTTGQPIPTPVDDQVALVWRDSLIYLISGWSQSRNVKNVQVYNPALDSWQQATPIIGAGVFGHAGGIVGDSIVYADGVKVSGLQFVMNPKSYLGVIDPADPTSITWSELPPHPGPAKYRMAAGSWGS
ncbi:MAG: galactose oxidase, partial [Calditrichaeota bacterium]